MSTKQVSKVKATPQQAEQQPVQQEQPPSPQVYSKSDFIHAKAIISAYRQQQKSKPKRTCTEKQLQALAAGRARNPRMNKKQDA